MASAKNHSQWGIRVARGLHAGQETNDSPLILSKGKVRIPANAQVQNQPLMNFPVILNEGAPFRSVEPQKLASTLQEEGGAPDQKIGNVVPGQLIRKIEKSGLMVRVPYIDADAHRFSAKLKLVVSFD